jgi:hypothetical protein
MNGLNTYRAVNIAVLVVCLTGAVALTTPPAYGALLPDRSNVRRLDNKKDDTKDKGKKEEEPKGDPVDVDKLPKAVINSVKKAYPGAVISKAAKLEDGNFYLDDVKVGKKILDLTVAPDGKIVKDVEMKE